MSQEEIDELLSDEGLAKIKEKARKSVTPEWWKRYGEEAWKTGLIVFGIISPHENVALKELVDSGEGFTCSLSGEKPTSGYAVCIYPETAVPIGSDLDLNGYLAKNMKMLARPDTYLGAWGDGGKMLLMVSVVTDNIRDAINLAQRHNQTHVYDIHNGREVGIE